jgi:hypothetical protein
MVLSTAFEIINELKSDLSVAEGNLITLTGALNAETTARTDGDAALNDVISSLASPQWENAGSYIAANNAPNVVVSNSGNLGVGTPTPVVRLDVAGSVRVGNATLCDTTTAGSIRWTGTGFEGCDGSSWKALGGSAATAWTQPQLLRFGSGSGWGPQPIGIDLNGNFTLPDGDTPPWDLTGHPAVVNAPDDVSSFQKLAGYWDGQVFCGLRLNGAIECWSALAKFGATNEPVQFTNGPYLDFATNSSTLCAAPESGPVECKRLDGNASQEASLPTGIKKVFGGATYDHTFCGLDGNADAFCWHLMGIDSTAWNTEKIPTSKLIGPFIHGEASERIACFVRESGEIYCWTHPTWPTAEVNAYSFAMNVPTNGPYVKIKTNRGFTGCALALDGHVDCWARDGLSNKTQTWKAALTGRTFVDLSAKHSDRFCFIDNNNGFSCLLN